jgi:hypothetical protein
MGVVLLVILFILVLGGLPATGWHHYGYLPSGGFGLVLVIVLVLVLLGRL